MFGISVEVLERIRRLSSSSIVKTDEKYLLKVLAISSEFHVRESNLRNSRSRVHLCVYIFEKLTNVLLSNWSSFDLRYSFIDVVHLLANLKYKFLLASLVFVLQFLQNFDLVLNNLLMK